MELENDEKVNSNEELPLKRGIEQLVEAVQGSKDGAKQVDGGAAAPEGAAAENSLGASTSSVSDGEGFEVCPPSAACALESPPPRSFSLARTVDCRSNAGHSCVLAERKGFLSPCVGWVVDGERRLSEQVLIHCLTLDRIIVVIPDHGGL